MKLSVSFAIVFLTVLIAQSFASLEEELSKGATKKAVNLTKGVMERTLNKVKELLPPSCLTEEKLPMEATLTRTKCLITYDKVGDTYLELMLGGSYKEFNGYRWIATYQPIKDGKREKRHYQQTRVPLQTRIPCDLEWSEILGRAVSCQFV